MFNFRLGRMNRGSLSENLASARCTTPLTSPQQESSVLQC